LEAITGQITLPRHTDDADLIAHQLLMLFAQYHRPGTRYTQVQVRIGDISAATPSIPGYFPVPMRSRSRPTRKL